MGLLEPLSVMQAVILGIIQGFTEFSPVSSSGHLIFLPAILGWSDQGLFFDVLVHLGSLIAVVVYFRNKIWSLILAFFSKDPKRQQERKLAWFIGLSILPAGIVGYLLSSNSRSATVVGISLIFWGIVLGIADKYAKSKKNNIDINNLKCWQVVAISCAQAIALIPGSSRSGITMTAGLFSGLTRKAAAEFSFLMSVPIIAIAGVVKFYDYMRYGKEVILIGPYAFGFLAAAISGFIAISLLMKIIQKWSFQPFMWYRIVIGIIILLVL